MGEPLSETVLFCVSMEMEEVPGHIEAGHAVHHHVQ